MTGTRTTPRRALRLAAVMGLIALTLGAAPAVDPFSAIELPDAWETRFWVDPGVKALLAMEPKAVADLVPKQAGFRYARCPACDSSEAEDTLQWSCEHPELLACRKCGEKFPGDKFPAKVDNKIPEETIEVRRGLLHHYPYHAVEAVKQRYPDERIYLAAKRDYEVREFLAKAALYAAVRNREKPDPKLARLACLLLVRFAQVYPDYAVHYDQPGEPKFLQQADMAPPYRRGYRSGKWDWSGALDVPLNLLMAHALVRSDPAMAEAGRSLGVPSPAAVVERDLFFASARFVANQSEEYDENSLQAYRGLFAVGRLLNDARLLALAGTRLDGFMQLGFYHDGFWRNGDLNGHRRVVGLLDSWIAPMLPGNGPKAKGAGHVPMLDLAHVAAAMPLSNPAVADVQLVAWPVVPAVDLPRKAGLLGGAGIARLAVGEAGSGLDLELSGLGNFGRPASHRLSLRLAVGGRIVLGDLDELPPTRDGLDLATASHNAVIVDGLNQREDPMTAQTRAPGGSVHFFAADDDFQVASIDDPAAYPKSTTRYRQTIVASSTPSSRYAVSIFEVHGGLRHDQWFHAAPGLAARWETSIALEPGSETLLPAGLTYLPDALAEDGRWFVQAYGAFQPIGRGPVNRPWTARLEAPGGPSVRLHLLGDLPESVITSQSPDPSRAGDPAGSTRPSLMLSRRSADGSTLKSTFITVFEPTGGASTLKRVGRVEAGPDAVVLVIETAQGTEHLVVNLTPGGTQTVVLADGRSLSTDGLVVRVNASGLVLAGGTFAESNEARVEQVATGGIVESSSRTPTVGGHGRFVVEADSRGSDDLVGRTLLIRHGDDVTRGWKISGVTPLDGEKRLELAVREDPGFAIKPGIREAQYHQFPHDSHPGPHAYHVSKITRRAVPPRGPDPAVERSGFADSVKTKSRRLFRLRRSPVAKEASVSEPGRPKAAPETSP